MPTTLRRPRSAPTPAPKTPASLSAKRPFDFTLALPQLRAAVKPFPKAALFELADEGFDQPFHILVACIISIRTFDEVSLPAARRLFAKSPTAKALAALSVREIDQLIYPCTFHAPKAAQIHAIAQRVAAEFRGQLPCDESTLLSFRGVGPKCANLVRGIACGQPSISVDIHVHRITNRWGIVRTATPEKTMTALTALLPKRYWIELNKLLVPFGKHICTGQSPKCSTCPLEPMCQKVGVRAHR